MSSDWRTIRLGDCCEKIGSGSTPRGGKDAYQDEGTIRLIRSQNVLNDGFSPSGIVFIDADQAKKLDAVSVQKGDVLLNITGDSVARVCQAPDAYLPARVNQHVAIIRPKSEILDAEFLRYFLVSPVQQDLMLGLASAGATRSALTKGMIEELKVTCPPLETQKLIARSLGALDDQITLLRETNETLEAIVQAIFKSWFVDFDPVKAKAAGLAPAGINEATAAAFPDSFDSSALGAIPLGWSVNRLGDLLELAYGKALKAEDRAGGDVPVYGSGGISGYHNAALVPHGSVIVGRKGTVGSLFWEDSPFYPIDTTFYVRPKLAPMTFCFYLMQRLGLESMNTDAAVPGLNRENAYRLNLVLPTVSVMAEFDKIASVLRAGIRSNLEEIKTLSELRDTLLPRLISGKLRIPETQEAVEEMA